MRPPARAVGALLAGLLMAPMAGAWGDSRVSVNAGADPEYLLQKFAGHGPKAESYVLAQGNSFGGLVRDSSLEKARFEEIAQVLAPDLAASRYFPAKDPKSADLIIVVHWGMTYVDHFFEEQGMEDALKDSAGHASPSGEPGVARPKATDNGFGAQDVAAMNAGTGSPADNLQLLGYDAEMQKAKHDALGKPFSESKADTLISEETFGEDIYGDIERYFVILEAYNLKSIKEGRKGVKPKLLWSIHYSITASNRNFTEALPAMSKVAAKYFGRSTNGLLQNAERVPEGKVEIGEPKTIDDKKTN